MKKTSPFNTRFDIGAMKALRLAAKKTDRSVSYIIRQAVNEWLKSQGVINDQAKQ